MHYDPTGEITAAAAHDPEVLERLDMSTLKTIDLVCNQEADTEALLVGLYKLRLTEPEFLLPLQCVEREPGYEALLESEQEFCRLAHVTPRQFLAAKENCLLQDNMLEAPLTEPDRG